MSREGFDLVAGHCPKCLSIDIMEVRSKAQDPQMQCDDCGLVFMAEEVVIGVDPIV